MTPPVTHEAVTSCRICAGQCGLTVQIADGRVVAAKGDRTNPQTRGYACIKGLTLHEAHASPDRILRPLKRSDSGDFVEIPLSQALDEIAAKLTYIIARDGPDAVAGFRGTMNYSNALANAMLPSWLASIGSRSFFSTMTIDQSAKWVTADRLGSWAAGRDPFEVADVLLLVGTNPLVSLSTFNFPLQNPVKAVKEAKARGLKLVVIDPRRSETAQFADVHLQPFPGEDVAVLAAILNIIIAQGWHDADFCEAYVDGFAAFRDAISHFTPEPVTARTGVSAADLVSAATAFAAPKNGRSLRGSAASGTGPNMAAHSNLAEHLVEALNVVCGRYARPGDPVMNPGVLGPRFPHNAQVNPPSRAWETSWRDTQGFGMIFGERMSATLPDAILSGGDDKIRALIIDGGNPVNALPQCAYVQAAFASLDLLVSIDPFLNASSQLAHYILPPPMMFERYDIGSRDYEAYTLFAPYAQYAPPVVSPPPGSETIDDWRVFWELAKRMELSLSFDGCQLGMEATPTSEELIEILLRHSAVPMPDIKAATAGQRFDVVPTVVQPAALGANGRFALSPPDIVAELNGIGIAPTPQAGSKTFRFACRRVRDVQNSMYRHLPSLRARHKGNPLWMNPADMNMLGLNVGDNVSICSQHGELETVVASDANLRRGVVSMSHGGGDHGLGVNVNALTHLFAHRDPINAMPVMTGFDVAVTPLPNAERRR
ncbi:MAG: molybdopterin-dependent oxidoreductase [Sphingorhabdus sp.]